MRRGQDGFTLIELLAGLAILAAAALLAMPLTRTAIAAHSLRSSASDIAAVARMARSAAIRSGAEQTMSIDLAARRYRIDGGIARSRALPAHIAFELIVPPGEQTGASARSIRFLPSGGSSGGRLVLRDGARTAIVEIDWLTGGASVVWTR